MPAPDTLHALLLDEWLRLLARQPITPPANPWLCDDDEYEPAQAMAPRANTGD